MLENNRISAVLVSTDLERSQHFYKVDGRTHSLAGDDQESPRLRFRRGHDIVDLWPRQWQQGKHKNLLLLREK